MIEVLLILLALPPAGQNEVMQQLKVRGELVSTMGPRLLVFRVAPLGLPALREHNGVQAVIERADDLTALKDAHGLSEIEWLFASAWAAQGKKTGPRSGAGLEWGAPGFEPPDRPPR